MSLEAWPKCQECGGRSFERRPFASEDDIICLDCGFVSKAAADGERERIDKLVGNKSEKGTANED